MVQIITRYDYEAQAKIAPGVNFDPKNKKADRSLTNQADMENADINKIMARYEKTGLLTDGFGVERKPVYGDFTQVKDYHSLLSSIRNVERAFGLLPVSLRNRFENDPQKLIDFLDNPENDAEAIKLGLKDRPVVETVVKKEETAGGTPAVGAVNGTVTPKE